MSTHRQYELQDFSTRQPPPLRQTPLPYAPPDRPSPPPTPQTPPSPPSTPPNPPPTTLLAQNLEKALLPPSAKKPSPPTQEALFRICLTEPSVDIDHLRHLVWIHGVPHAVWARPTVWRLLLGLLPPDRARWRDTLAARRAAFWATVAHISVDPTQRPLASGDHPLSEGVASCWRQFFEDRRLREVIRTDVERTHPGLVRMEPVRAGLQRLLFVYAKTHSDVGYRQGMNELAAPFLLVFAEERALDLSDVTADAYFCFEVVMAAMEQCYAVVEREGEGIHAQLSQFEALFRIKDPVLERHLHQLGVQPRFYALRWLRVWLAREFDLPDLLVLWDSFLTSEQRLLWVRYVCVAMLLSIRERLLATDFVDCIKLLLHYPACDVAHVLRIADRLRTSNVVIATDTKR